MQIKRGINPLDGIVYIIACILTLGGAWALRVIISKAIIDATES